MSLIGTSREVMEHQFFQHPCPHGWYVVYCPCGLVEGITCEYCGSLLAVKLPVGASCEHAEEIYREAHREGWFGDPALAGMVRSV